jgi:sulfonate transport system substrate-binding protein
MADSFFAAARRAVAAVVLCMLGANAFAQSGPSSDTVRIGFQKSSTLITLLKARGTLERALAPLHVSVSWSEFASGLPLTEALNAGGIDITADMADTVPVFAQAANANFLYFAQEAPSPLAQAIVVPATSPIKTLADLKGHRIAVAQASGSHYLLLAALRRAGLTTTDVRISSLAPADGRAALERGSVDAWVTWDPYLAAVQRQSHVRIVSGEEGLASYQRYYLVSSAFAARRPDVVRVLYQQLVAEGRWVKAHPHAAARILAPLWGLDQPTVELSDSRRSYLVRPIEAANFGEQQKIADVFWRAKLLPHRVDTNAAGIWHPVPDVSSPKQ